MFKDLMMGAAKATYEQLWKHKMKQIKDINKAAYHWLYNLERNIWCKYVFSHLMKACLWGFYGGWIFELQWGLLMVIFSPWRCSGRQRRRGEGRHHPLGNKPRKKELHHQELPWIRSLKRML